MSEEQKKDKINKKETSEDLTLKDNAIQGDSKKGDSEKTEPSYPDKRATSSSISDEGNKPSASPKAPIKKATAPKPNSNVAKLSSGALLEYRIQRLLFYMGYLSKVGVEIATSQEEDAESITDLDVYGIYIHKDFRYKTIWADCKSGRAKPLERISWIKGVKEILDIDDVMFVKGGVKSTIKQFARKSDVQVLDLTLIQRLETDFSIKEDDWSGPWNPKLSENKIKDFSRLSIPQNEIFKKIAKFISTDYWSTEKYTSLKKCITAFKELSAIPIDSLSEKDQKTVLWGIYQLTTLFSLSLFKIIRELYFYTEHERKNALHDGMISGEISIKKRQELVSASYRLAFELIKSQYPDFKPPMKLINISPPSYFESLNDLINRITHEPLKYFDVLRVLDYSILEYDLQKKDWDLEELKYRFDITPENIQGIKTILHFICHVTGIPKSYYKILS